MKTRRIALFVFTGLFVIETVINRGASLTPFQWVMLALAASMVGRACAYLAIFEWLRAPFTVTVPHSSGAGADNHSRWTTGIRSAIGDLLCCPVCAGTWGAAIILTIFKFIPAWGEAIMITLSAAAVAWLLTYVTQLVEWKTQEARETTGLIRRQNQQKNGDTQCNSLYEQLDVILRKN